MRAMILSIAVVMAATGCETDNTAYEATRARNLEKYKQPFKPRFQPGTDMMGIPPTPVVYQPLAPQPEPQPVAPVVITAPGRGVTMASQVGGTTVVTSFGGTRIATPYNPPIDTSGTPIYYTAPIQQP